MSSRVQKGGLVFKPIAKSRVRATSTAPRQASTPAESHGSGAPASDVSTPGVGSMPPPSIIPVRAVDAGVLVSDTPQPIASSSRLPTAAPVLIASGSRTPAPPTIAASPQTIQARSAPAPPVIASSVPTVRAAAPPTIASSAPYAPPAVSGSGSGAFLPETSEDFQFPATLSQLVPPITVSNTASNPDSTVKPRKLRKRKKADTTDGDATEGDKSDEPSTKKPKKKRAKKGATEGTDDGVEKPKKRKKAAKTADDVVEDPDSPVRKRQKKAQTPFDPDADPGEELDPTVVTMADLCDDSGQGRVSSKAAEIQKNHIEWKKQSKEKRARMKALAERKKYGRPEDEEDAEATANANDAGAEAAATDAVEDDAGEVVGVAEPSEAAPVIVDESGSGFDYSKDLTASRFTVQVRIGPNGETIIDEESLTVDRAEGEDTANYVHVVESDHTKFVNSLSYTKKCRGSRWSAEETELFFDALSQHGQNYELISLMLPGRSRTACINKFKAEDRKDSARITRCIESRRPIDMQTLTRITGKDFSGPVPVIRMPTPPPIPDPATQSDNEKSSTTIVRKRSRSRALPSAEGVEIVGSAEDYKDD